MLPEPRRFLALSLLALGAAFLGSCAAALNFAEPAGPRYADCCMSSSVRPATASGLGGDVSSPHPDELRVVTFNIKYGKRIDKAIELLDRAPDLETADVVLLQEMDAIGVERIAAQLGMCYVYYPATVHPVTSRLFGPAILSRWPLSEDRKVVLPHLGRFRKTERIAVAATMHVRGRAIRVYSVHVATGIEVGPGGRRDQILALLADAGSRYERVIIGGDLNARGLGKLIAARGYEWPTRDLGRTTRFGGVDHIFVRGLDLKTGANAGKVRDNLGASDHKPVWAALTLHSSDSPGGGGEPGAGVGVSGTREPVSSGGTVSRRP